MAVHELLPDRRTVHGHFSRDLPPALGTEPGDTIRARTLRADWDDAGFDLDPRLDSGHALTGPCFVNGAVAGDALSVDIVSVLPAARAARTGAGGRRSPVNAYLGLSGHVHRKLEWEIDHDRNSAGRWDSKSTSIPSWE